MTTPKEDYESFEWLDRLLRDVAIETSLADRQAQTATRPRTVTDANTAFNHSILRGKHKIIELIKTRDEQRGKISVNRVEVIDHTDGGEGRVFTKWTEGDYQVELSEQDGGKTLKVFFTQPPKQETN